MEQDNDSFSKKKQLSKPNKKFFIKSARHRSQRSARALALKMIPKDDDELFDFTVRFLTAGDALVQQIIIEDREFGVGFQ